MKSATKVLEEFYAAEAEYVAARGQGRADFGRLASCLDPDVIIRQAPDLPFSGDGDWTGYAGVLAFMDAFAETWHSMEVLAQHVVGDHETVVVLLDVRFVSAATRRSLTTSIAQVNTIKAGRIAEIRPYYWEPAAVQRVCDATQAGG